MSEQEANAAPENAPAPGDGIKTESIEAQVPGATAPADAPAEAEEAKTEAAPMKCSALDPKLHPIGIVLCASIVTWIAAARKCDTRSECTNEEAWAVACGFISMLATLGHYISSMIAATRPCHDKISPAFAVVLFVWWLFGVGAGTFEDPFKQTDNGYFAEWIAFFASMYYMANEVPFMAKALEASQHTSAAREQQLAALVVIFSLIELTACVVECNDHHDCSGTYGWAVFVGTVSSVCAIGYLLLHTICMDRKPCFGLSISAWYGYGMLILWCWGCGVLTFDKPFRQTGNGYFSSWGAMISSILFAGVAGGHLVPTDDPKSPPIAETINLEMALPVGRGSLFLESRLGTVMSIMDSKDADGSTVAAAVFDDHDHCKWTLQPTDEDEWYYLVPAVNSDKSRALHIPQKSLEDGTVATLMTLPEPRTADKSDNFKVAFTQVSESSEWFYIVVKHSRKYLQVDANGPGAEISQHDMKDDSAFHWKFISQADDFKGATTGQAQIAGAVPGNVISK